ncbi:MAG: RsmD family RNA methyltransferase [Gemmatimonadaceae bacterium]
MRIIAGEWRGRTIKAPRDQRVRPTGDRAREAWMSILQHQIPDARVADLCAGSGALGLEALSRGAAFCDFVELSESAIRAIRENATALGALPRMTIHKADAIRYVQRTGLEPWDLAFADPPYNLGIAARLAKLWHTRPFARVFSVEHDAHEELPGAGETRVYGGTGVTIYRLQGVDAVAP